MLSSPSASSARSRKDVATQACETCRRRKTKCDEKRPKCTLCQRLNLDCHYKEADEDKKDEGAARILEALKRVELKIDNIAGSSSSSQIQTTPGWSSSHGPQQTPLIESVGTPIRSEQRSQDERLSQIRPPLTIPHKIILWPSIYSQLVGVKPQVGPDLQAIYEGGTPWLIRQEMQRQGQGLPFADGMPYVLVSNVADGQFSFQSRVSFPSLTIENMRRSTDAYFQTFNMLYPILDYDLFTTETLEPVIRNGFGYGDSASVLALLVLALGNLAAAVVTGTSNIGEPEIPSGVPGFALFNEARARLGSILFQCELVNVQIQILIATYFEANGCHVEFWQSTVSASMICQVLASSSSVEWHTFRGDAIKRAYWTCVINEDLYHLDLDLPRTSIHELEDSVPLPHFDGKQSRSNPAAGDGTEDEAILQYYFVAKSSLKRLISSIHEGIHLHSNQSESSDDYRDPPIHVIRELSRQLETWRALLPVPLQWSDEDIYSKAEAEHQAIDPALGTEDFDEVATRPGRDVLTAELRTRFYYARYILYRPFIFKSLHFPQLMNTQNEEHCAFAVRAACLWPVTMAPTKTTKPLIPHLFSWTQNFIGILLILWTSQYNQCLRRICDERVDRRMIDTSTALMLQWIADMKRIDRLAEWSLRLLEPLFPQAI